MRLRSLRRRLRNERASVLVLVTLAMPALFLITSLVIDFGNWYEHKRHLQTQADAAAFAGAYDWNACFDGSGGANVMFQSATDYAGADGDYWGTLFGGATHNFQVGGTPASDVRALYQSPTYWQQTSPVDSSLATQTSPCDPPFVFDVKATELNLHAYIPLISSIFPPVNAHARVQLFRETQGKAGLPLAIPVPDPNSAPEVTLVNESTGAELADFYVKTKTAETGYTNWTGTSPSFTVPADAQVGIRVNGSTTSLATIRGYSTTGTGSANAPILRDVWPITCSGSPFFSDLDTIYATPSTTTCTSGVGAVVDWGAGADPTQEQVRATLVAPQGCGNNQQTLLTRQSDGSWQTDSWTVPYDCDRFDIALDWRYGNSGNWNAFAGGKPIQAIYSADDAAKAVDRIGLLDPGAGNLGAPWALPGGTTQQVTVSIGMMALTLNKEIPLRLTGGSRTTAIACDGSGNNLFTTALLSGCSTTYQVNIDGVCPDPTPPPGAPDCIALKTGSLGSTVTTALNQRYTPCPANNYPDYQPDDPRIVQLYLTDYSAVGGSGSNIELPITGLARFYLAGWSGNDCGDVWPFPYPEPTGGDLWGYFIKQTDSSDNTGTQVCTGDALDPCAPKLTR